MDFKESTGYAGKWELTKTSEVWAGRIQEGKAKNYLNKNGYIDQNQIGVNFNFNFAYISFLKLLTSCTLLNLRTLLSWANKWGAGFKLWNKPNFIVKQELKIFKKFMRAPVRPLWNYMEWHNSVVLLETIHHVLELWTDKLKLSHELVLVRFSIYY